MPILAVANQKGGVGKSTLAVNLGVEAVRQGLAVLLVDADPQGSAALFAAVRDEALPRFDTIQLTKPILHKELPSLGKSYDLVVIDVGGRDSATFRSALVAADEVLIPMGPSAADVWSTEDVFQLLDEVAVGRQVRAYAIFTRVVPRTRIARDASGHVEDLLEKHEIRLLDTPIHARVAWPQAFGEGLGVAEFEPSGSAARELVSLVQALGIVPHVRPVEIAS